MNKRSITKGVKGQLAQTKCLPSSLLREFTQSGDLRETHTRDKLEIT